VFEVRMPQWGMNMTEGTIIKWFKEVGERIEKGEPLAEVEIAKAIQPLESPVAGVVTKLVANIDETILVQGVIAIIDD
jgi:pyruvate/2-oxoglutarate dehydrogenase complex dihydrolipoamide acyltransferase (E2) component